MQDRDETLGRPDDEGGLTTESLAHPGSDERSTAVYPGEATGDRDLGAGTGGRTDEDTGVRGTAGDDLREDEPARADEADTTAAGTREGAGAAGDTADEPLLAGPDAEEFRRRWGEIQGRFVDDPQDAVRSADTLVAEVMQTLAGTFSSHKQELEGQWSKGEEPVTEDLRIALQRYRSFFNRLLHT
ncbi:MULTISPECIES: hypothetical protein [unclassified Streptomyces]|uniref:hypothetical protein n=1 Tax=unclassified Streptomyces TaxID=2593676 RepID=UPI002E335A07|nr:MULTISPECIES: hypothetical protein [unclassified Streptomyces]WUC63532.1 hypothetical protein OG861_04465 [Streptomyces sp. NBC_00539]